MTISDDDRLKLSSLLEDLRTYIRDNTPSHARRDALLMSARDTIYALRKGKPTGVCPECGGYGCAGCHAPKCKECGGDGYTEIQSGPYTRPCESCAGTGKAKANPVTEAPPGMLRIAQPDQVMEDGILFFQRGISGGGAVYGSHLTPEAYGDALRKQVGKGHLILSNGVWWFKPLDIYDPLLQALRAITSPANVRITDVTTQLMDYLLDQIADNGMSHEIADRIRREHLVRVGGTPRPCCPDGACDLCIPDEVQLAAVATPAVDTSILSGLTRGTVLKLKLCEAEYVNITHAGPVDGKYSGWLTELYGRPIINTDPRFDTPEEAEQHIRDILAATRDWREPTP